MNRGIIAHVAIDIKAPAAKVWNALTDPHIISQYMFGTEVTSDWEVGSSITWKGEWKGKSYEDKGKILKVIPLEILQYTHFSPLDGIPDSPENYHTLTYELREVDGVTRIELAQDSNLNKKAMEHATDMWQKMLKEMKKVVENAN